MMLPEKRPQVFIFRKLGASRFPTSFGTGAIGAPERYGLRGPPNVFYGQPGPPVVPGLPLPPHSFPDQTWNRLTGMSHFPAVMPTSRPLVLSDPNRDMVHHLKIENKGITTAAPSPVSVQAPAAILSLPGPTMDRLCVDIRHSQGPMDLLLDPGQGLEVTGQYQTEKAGFLWVEVTFKNPQLQVHVTPERVVVTRNRKSSEYKWKETLFSVLPGLKMTMDKTGLLLLSGPDKITIGLSSRNGPEKGLLLLLRDPDHRSRHVSGTLGQFYQDVLWEPPAATDDSRRVLRVQEKDYSVTRELRWDAQEGTEIACWSVEL